MGSGRVEPIKSPVERLRELVMSNVHSVGTSTSVTTLREFAQTASRQTPVKTDDSSGDKVEISELASLLNRLAELPEERARKIIDIRNAIQRGTYETEDRLAAATEAVFQEL